MEMAYGTLYETPPGLTTHRLSSTDGKGKRRVSSNMHCVHRRTKHSPWLWIKFSITLAFAIGVALKDGPGSLMKRTICGCRRREDDRIRGINEQRGSATN